MPQSSGNSPHEPLEVVAQALPRPRRRRWAGWLVAAVVLGVLAYHGLWLYHAKRFQVVREGVFYRLGQPTELGLRHLVRQYGIKTVLSVQLYDFRLYRGIYDPAGPSGVRESECVRQLGATPVQWPMGVEQSWPWLTPWQFEQFFRLIDDPANLPVAVHCQGGRHRTGTLSALFRLEYDRWPVERVLAEMYSFKFGPPIRLQEHNLRTYLPRPHPTTAQWQGLRRDWQPVLPDGDLDDYESLVRQLRSQRGRWGDILTSYLDRQRAFTLPLVQRLIDSPDDALAPFAAEQASRCLERLDADRASWAAAAALVADFGTPEQQARLLELLGDAAFEQASRERFDAVVAGVTNRYTPNRIAYLRPLLENENCHLAEGARTCRYCDTAVARLSSIIDKNLPDLVPALGIDAWNNGRQAAREWFRSHPEDARLSQLKPPSGHTVVQLGDPPQREDLSRIRR